MKNAFLKNFSANDLLEMINHKKYCEYDKGKYLFREKEVINGVYFLLSGKVNITKTDSYGKDSILYNIKAPDIICLHTIMEEEFHPNSALALEKCKVYFVSKKALRKLIEDNSIAALNIMRMLCLKINKIENQLSGYT
jgi:CRP-like cAMP-binding protein